MTRGDISDRVVSLAEKLEQGARLGEDMDVLECRYEITESGDVREVTAVVTVGGPYLAVECLSGVITGTWGSDRHRTHVDSDAVTAFGERHADRMEARID
jgi:hypothetical protein